MLNLKVKHMFYKYLKFYFQQVTTITFISNTGITSEMHNFSNEIHILDSCK